jgi:Fe-S-cluster containining protein
MLVLMRLPDGDSELVQIVDAALAEASRRAGKWLVCRPGCTQCCHGVFAINALDALRLRTGMAALREEQPAMAAAVELRARSWLDEYLPNFPGDPVTGLLGCSDVDRESFEEFANEAACPALDPATGLCDVYAWRPMTCRVFGPPIRMDAGESEGNALGCCELCFAGAGEAEIAACEMPVPHRQESQLLDEIGQSSETVVAFALLG